MFQHSIKSSTPLLRQLLASSERPRALTSITSTAAGLGQATRSSSCSSQSPHHGAFGLLFHLVCFSLGNLTTAAYLRKISADHPVQPTSRTSLRLLPLGGSVTYGVGSSTGNGYREFLRAMLVAHGYDPVIVGSRKSGSMSNNENEGWRGYRLDQIDKKVRSSVEKLAPNVFAINAGSNDCIQDFKLDEFRERMSGIVQFLWQTDPSSTVVLSTLLVNADEKVNSRVLRVNEQIRDLVVQETSRNNRIVLADMHGVTGPQVDDLVDGTHPGDTGYQVMAGIWFDAIQEAREKGFFAK